MQYAATAQSDRLLGATKLKMNAELGYAYGKLPTPYRFNHTARANIDVQRQVIQKEDFSGFVGLSASSLTQFRRAGGSSGLNLSLLYESTLGVGPSFSMEYVARNQDGFELSLRLPLATFYIDRPYELIDNYAIDGVNRPNINGLWRFSRIGPIFHINLRMHYHIYINSKNRLSLLYNWEYNQQNIVPINRFRGVHHVFMLQYSHYFTMKKDSDD